ncbi:unnamed protein product, partial [Ceratitis capitata]
MQQQLTSWCVKSRPLWTLYYPCIDAYSLLGQFSSSPNCMLYSAALSLLPRLGLIGDLDKLPIHVKVPAPAEGY